MLEEHTAAIIYNQLLMKILDKEVIESSAITWMAFSCVIFAPMALMRLRCGWFNVFEWMACAVLVAKVCPWMMSSNVVYVHQRCGDGGQLYRVCVAINFSTEKLLSTFWMVMILMTVMRPQWIWGGGRRINRRLTVNCSGIVLLNGCNHTEICWNANVWSQKPKAQTKFISNHKICQLAKILVKSAFNYVSLWKKLPIAINLSQCSLSSVTDLFFFLSFASSHSVYISLAVTVRYLFCIEECSSYFAVSSHLEIFFLLIPRSLRPSPVCCLASAALCWTFSWFSYFVPLRSLLLVRFCFCFFYLVTQE